MQSQTNSLSFRSFPGGLIHRLRRLDANLRPGDQPSRRCLTMRRGVTSKHRGDVPHLPAPSLIPESARVW